MNDKLEAEGSIDHRKHTARRRASKLAPKFGSHRWMSWVLTESSQFANAFFDTETKVKIAKALDAFGVEYIELTSPASSEQSRRDCEIICKLGLKASSTNQPCCAWGFRASTQVLILPFG